MAIQRVSIDEATFDKIYDCFDKMEFKAEDFVPTEKELLEMMQNLPKYMPFLMWIDETGYDMEEDEEQNAMRSRIRKLISMSVKMEE